MAYQLPLGQLISVLTFCHFSIKYIQACMPPAAQAWRASAQVLACDVTAIQKCFCRLDLGVAVGSSCRWLILKRCVYWPLPKSELELDAHFTIRCDLTNIVHFWWDMSTFCHHNLHVFKTISCSSPDQMGYVPNTGILEADSPHTNTLLTIPQNTHTLHTER